MQWQITGQCYKIHMCFEFIKNFIDKGPCKLIYRQRATLLRKIEYFVSKNTCNVITINAFQTSPTYVN